MEISIISETISKLNPKARQELMEIMTDVINLNIENHFVHIADALCMQDRQQETDISVISTTVGRISQNLRLIRKCIQMHERLAR